MTPPTESKSNKIDEAVARSVAENARARTRTLAAIVATIAVFAYAGVFDFSRFSDAAQTIAALVSNRCLPTSAVGVSGPSRSSTLWR